MAKKVLNRAEQDAVRSLLVKHWVIDEYHPENQYGLAYGKFGHYAEEWSDSRIAELVGNGCTADHVERYRKQFFGVIFVPTVVPRDEVLLRRIDEQHELIKALRLDYDILDRELRELRSQFDTFRLAAKFNHPPARHDEIPPNGTKPSPNGRLFK